MRSKLLWVNPAVGRSFLNGFSRVVVQIVCAHILALHSFLIMKIHLKVPTGEMYTLDFLIGDDHHLSCTAQTSTRPGAIGA